MIGDTNNTLERQKSLIPPGWFADKAPLRHAILGGLGTSLSWIYGFVGYAKAQTRIATTTGFMLDLAAWDFFGSRFMRRQSETDDSFRPRILKEILRPRVTRAAISQALFDLTGIVPTLNEPWNPGDNGGWGPQMAWGGAATPAVTVTGWNSPQSRYGGGTFAFATPMAAQGGGPGVGSYGSMSLSNQILIRAHRGSGGVLNVGPAGGYNSGPLAWGGQNPSPPAFLGWGATQAGWSTPQFGWLVYAPPYAVSPGFGFYTDSAAQERASDADIYAAVAATKGAGVTAWVHIDP